MTHDHVITDQSGYFSIDPATRLISLVDSDVFLVRGDHNSERITFQMPRFVEGHDMYQSDRIEIHYTNITKNKKEQNDNVYFVPSEDVFILDTDSDVLLFSWLISRNATSLVGKLNFSVGFTCLDDEGNVDYEWGTKTYESIQILTRLNNDESVEDAYPDFYVKLKDDCTPKKGIDYWTPEEQQEIIAKSKGDPGYTPQRGKDYWTPEDQRAMLNKVLETLPTWEGGSY